jgi:hypothetical protein
MSWTNVGPKTDLAPGQSAFWSYVFKNNQDVGLQLAGPNVNAEDLGPATLGTLVASNQGKQINGLINLQNAQVAYLVTITNIDPSEFGIHNLQGGGVS